MLVRPCVIEKSDILLSTKNITSGDGQSGYGNLLRCTTFCPLANANRQSGRRRLLQALTTDSTPGIESACYRRCRRQQLVRSLKAVRWVFLKEFLQENYERLWKIFELIKR